MYSMIANLDNLNLIH